MNDSQRESAWDSVVIKFLRGASVRKDSRGQMKTDMALSAFYGSLLTSLKLTWSKEPEKVPTACVNEALRVLWDTKHFDELPQEGRLVVLRHEVEHVARMHFLRMGDRDPKTWNIATDFEINNDLVKEGYRIDLFNGLYDPKFEGMTAEDIYAAIKDDPPETPEGFALDLDNSGGSGDETEGGGSSASVQGTKDLINAVSKAIQAAKMENPNFGIDSPGYKYTLDTFFKPVIRWEQYVRQWLTEKLNKRESFNRRNRRFPSAYMPGRVPKDGALTGCNFYLDVSGSVTDEMVHQFVSEAKYVHTKLKPSTLRLVQFDHEIQAEEVLTPFSKFDDIEVVGRGGTDLVPVREHILKTKPKLVVVITDLWCYPMEPVAGVDIVWVVWNNSTATVNQGKIIHVEG